MVIFVQGGIQVFLDGGAVVTDSIGVAQGVHVRAVLVDPCAQLIGSSDGSVAGDDDIATIDLFINGSLIATGLRSNCIMTGTPTEGVIGANDNAGTNGCSCDMNWVSYFATLLDNETINDLSTNYLHEAHGTPPTR